MIFAFVAVGLPNPSIHRHFSVPSETNNMTTSKSTITAQTTLECCMCGDYGFSNELFQCKICQFRSQHRYCSNLYPNAESYKICNWCLTTKEKSPNSSNSSSSCRNNREEHIDNETKIIKKKNSSTDEKLQGGNLIRSLGSISRSQLQLNGPIKKQRPVETSIQSPRSPSIPNRKRIITVRAKEENLRRTRSDEISNGSGSGGGGITKPVFRNKVRRYKLLDEVSS